MTYDYETAAYQKGAKAVCGIDEAGRGPLAGPVCAAAVVLPQGLTIVGLNDSKKLSPKKRETLFAEIIEKASSYAIVFVDETEIDRINILQATFRAMEQACAQVPADYALVDGNQMPKLAIAGETIVKGDAKSPSIAAASILAKVSRDRLMDTYDSTYPQYGFIKHKGYGTKDHVAALKACGSCPIHRVSFLKKILPSAHEE